MDWQQYIHSDPKILLGKPTVKVTRLSVEFILIPIQIMFAADNSTRLTAPSPC
jgi:uncharacterized protein (DUF433 family)